MKKVVKQVVGIDVAHKELVVCLGCMYDDWQSELCAHQTFANTPKGYERLGQWIAKLTVPQVAVRYVMEATAWAAPWCLPRSVGLLFNRSRPAGIHCAA